MTDVAQSPTAPGSFVAGATAEPPACLNCGAAMTGPFCASCGQRQPHTDLTLREFLHETTQELTHWEGRVPSTLRTLFLEPGRLTLDFLAGRRARWLSPLRLYLICSIAYFLSGSIEEAVTGRTAREVADVTITNDDGTTTLTPAGREELAQSLPGRLFGVERMERAATKTAELNRAFDTAYPRAMFVLLPIFALLTSIAWRRRLPRYPAHLYVALHLHAAWFGAGAIMTLASIPFSSVAVQVVLQLAAWAYGIGYGLLAARRLFGEPWPRTVGKSVAVSAVYSIFLFTVSLGMLAWAVLTM